MCRSINLEMSSSSWIARRLGWKREKGPADSAGIMGGNEVPCKSADYSWVFGIRVVSKRKGDIVNDVKDGLMLKRPRGRESSGSLQRRPVELVGCRRGCMTRHTL